MRLGPERYLAAIGPEAEALTAAAQAGCAAAVPTCPGWSVADVVAHVGRVHRRAAYMVSRRSLAEEPFSVVGEAPAGKEALLGWFGAGTAALCQALSAAGAGAPVWNWTAGPQLAGF